MSKPYTESDFSRQVTEDRTWRMREITDMRSIIERSDQLLQKVLLRGLVTICYAHWEGYVKFAATKYMEYIALRKFRFVDLDRQFTRNHFLPRLSHLENSKSNYLEKCELVDCILDSTNDQFKRIHSDLISTQSNLSFKIFSAICVACGIPIQSFKEYEDFVDIFLLKRRNAIAHGEDTFVAISDLPIVADKTIALMRNFGDLLENHITLKKYRSQVM